MNELYEKTLKEANRTLARFLEQKTTFEEQLPILIENRDEVRKMAYPAKGETGTESQVTLFKKVLDAIGRTSRALRDIERGITKTNKFLSALRYFKFQQSSKGKEILAIDCNNLEKYNGMLNELIRTADVVVVFNRELDIPLLEEYLGINVSDAPKGKFVSIQHLLRPFTNFEKLDPQPYCDLVGYHNEPEEDFDSVVEGIYRKATEV